MNIYKANKLILMRLFNIFEFLVMIKIFQTLLKLLIVVNNK